MLAENRGSLASLKVNDKGLTGLVAQRFSGAKEPKTGLPVYGEIGAVAKDYVGKRNDTALADLALGMAIHAYHGAKIEIKDYQLQNGVYSANVEYTFYDHFGLDDDDWKMSYGFPAWFALQHDATYKGAGSKPPIVVLKVSRKITGRVD